LSTVGIIANPAAGKDIRRLVAHGRFVPNQEKVNIIKRILAGLDAVGVDRVVMMPDSGMLGRAALDGASLSMQVEFLDITMFNEERDSSKSAKAMAEMGVGCIVTLGGDGTNRAVALGSGSVPLVPVSTGTNNVFPSMVEGTIAGLAAGVVARGLVDMAVAVRASKRLEVYVEEKLRDIALIDLAVSTERFVGARAIWDMATIDALYLTRAEPGSIGLSAIGAQLHPIAMDNDEGLYLRPGEGDISVLAPVAPGMVIHVPIQEYRVIRTGEDCVIELHPCTIALDGERSFSVRRDETAFVRLTRNGPPVVQIDAVLREAAINRVFLERNGSNGV
jgi:predicted polyphosphate/ATP-dependent NAD kinase